MRRRELLLGIAAGLVLPGFARGGEYYLKPAGIGIIYGEKSGIIRRIVCTDEPETLPGHVGLGERMFIPTRPLLASALNGYWLPNEAECRRLVAQECGFEAESARCLVINDVTGETVDVILADPAIDKIEGHTLVQEAS